MHSEEIIVIVLSSLGIFGGVFVIWIAMRHRSKIREMEHRERLAMIERGLLPSPEVDPAGFEQKAGTVLRDTASSARARTAGVMIIGLGLAFMFFMSFAVGEPALGIGLGGAFAVLGAAFFINSLLMERSDTYLTPMYRPAPPQRVEGKEPPNTL